MDLLMQRLKHVDSFLPAATVSMEQLTDNERKVAAELAAWSYLVAHCCVMLLQFDWPVVKRILPTA